MKNSLHIQLNNVPDKGWEFHFDRQSKDLNLVLKKLIGDNDYGIKVHIQPLGEQTYQIKGDIKTNLNLLCSRCAYEFKHPIDKRFSEKIIVQKKLKRNEKEIHVNHYSEQTNEEGFMIINNPIFKLADFIHEIIAVEEPLRPLKSSECDKNNDCENLKNVKNKNIFYKNTMLEDQLKPFLKNQSSIEDSD